MWCEERLERVGVLQKVRLTSIVLFKTSFWTVLSWERVVTSLLWPKHATSRMWNVTNSRALRLWSSCVLRLWRCHQVEIAGLGVFFQFAKNVTVQEGAIAVVLWVGYGPEMSSVAGRLLTRGALKSHSTLWQVPEEVWKLCGNIEG
jgi:hypothetical protein